VLVNYYDHERRIQWKWQGIDTKMVAAPLGGDLTGPNLTDRAKSGSKRHILVDQRGASLSILITSANAHDITCVLTLVDRLNIASSKTKYRVHHLCADKGYDSEPFRRKLLRRKIVPHIRKSWYASRPAPPPLESQLHPARRWVVERTLSWRK
jgi:putative transposase